MLYFSSMASGGFGGNGRIARAIADMALARAEHSRERFPDTPESHTTRSCPPRRIEML